MYVYDGHSRHACEEWSQCPQHRTETHMSVKLETLPEQVRTFVQALIANAKEAHEGWGEHDYEDGRCFADMIPGVESQEDGTYIVCDNFERFFSTMYHFIPEGEGRWEVRNMYGEGGWRPYTYEKALADASIMFTG